MAARRPWVCRSRRARGPAAAGRPPRGPLRAAPPPVSPAAGRRFLPAASASTRPSRKPTTWARTSALRAALGAMNLAEIADARGGPRRRPAGRPARAPGRSSCRVSMPRPVACQHSPIENHSSGPPPLQTSARPRSISAELRVDGSVQVAARGFEDRAAARQTAVRGDFECRRQVQARTILANWSRRPAARRAGAVSFPRVALFETRPSPVRGWLRDRRPARGGARGARSRSPACTVSSSASARKLPAQCRPVPRRWRSKPASAGSSLRLRPLGGGGFTGGRALLIGGRAGLLELIRVGSIRISAAAALFAVSAPAPACEAAVWPQGSPLRSAAAPHSRRRRGGSDLRRHTALPPCPSG